jgi:hypothetical protein
MVIGLQHPISIQTPKLVCKCKYRLVLHLVITFLTGLCADLSPASTQETSPLKGTPPPPPREVTWSFDSSIMMFNKTLPDESKLDGTAGSLRLVTAGQEEIFGSVVAYMCYQAPGERREMEFLTLTIPAQCSTLNTVLLFLELISGRALVRLYH